MASNDSPGNPSNLKVAIVALMFIGTILALFSLWFNGCAVGPSKTVVQAPTTAAPPSTGTDTGTGTGPGPAATCDGQALGAKKDLGCPAGQTGDHTQSCTATGWVDLDNTCHVAPTTKPACSTVTTFDQLQPVITLNCASCHQGFDQYAKAAQGVGTVGVDAGKPLIDAMIRRIQLDPSDADHMPAQRASLSAKDIATFVSWKSTGLLAAGDCTGAPPPPPQAQVDFSTFEQQMASDINKVAIGDQPNTRYLVANDQVNFGSPASIAIAKAAGAKAANMVSTNRSIRPVVNVAPGIWRININDLGISPAQWVVIEKASLLQFESFTNTGVELKTVAQTRLPWMNVADFNDTVLHNATVYYNLTKAPATLNQLLVNLGVNFASDLQAFKATQLAFNGSTLSLAANRLIARFDSNDGFFWLTEDTGKIVSDTQNVFKNPLIAAGGGQANLAFAAGEQFYSLPNGLMGSFLALANGNRLDAADPAVVHDFTTNPISPIIANAISCSRCHNAGLIPAVDKVRAAIASSGIGAADTDRALALYKPQPVVNSQFTSDNARVAAAMAALGQNPQDPDPISSVSDGFLGNLTAERVAGLYGFTSTQPLFDCINLSTEGKQQAGQLLTGGNLSHDQFVQVNPILKRDCLIFQNPI